MSIYGSFSLVKNIIFFPFLRTTIACDDVDPLVNQHSGDWSGSAFCSDVDFVARHAQFVKGTAEGFDQGVHCLMLPLLGHMIDVYGRRCGVLIGLCGVLLQTFFFLIASLAGTSATAANFWVIIGSVVQGMTGIYMAAVNASVRDVQVQDKLDDKNHSSEKVQPSSSHESTAFGLIQVCQGASNGVAMSLAVGLILSKNLSSYTKVWIILCALIALALAWLWLSFPETHPGSARVAWDWRKASPWSLVKLFLEEKTRFLAAATFLVVLSMTSISILQAFTVSRYRWTQTYSTVVFAVLSPIAIVSLAASFVLIPRIGPEPVIAWSFVALNLGILMFCFAPISSVFCFLGMGFIFCTPMCMPAFMQLVTSLSEPGETGQLLANIGAMALSAVALGNLLYGFLFRHYVSMQALSFYTAMPVMLLATLAARLARRDLAKWKQRVQDFSSLVDSEQDDDYDDEAAAGAAAGGGGGGGHINANMI